MDGVGIKVSKRDRNYFEFNSQGFEFPEHSISSVSEMVFGFLEGIDELDSQESSISCRDRLKREMVSENEEEEEDDQDERNNGGVEESKKFWETQHHLLHATLRRSSSLETSIRNATKKALKEIEERGTHICECGRVPVVSGCRSCLMREVSGHLQKAGFDCAICKSKWRSYHGIPSGEHTFLDVVDNTSSKKGVTRVIIELNFRAEFEMAKGNEDYNMLVRKLPDVFVGKVKKLQTLIKILCCAAKKCMKEKKMHLGPWRKHKYMEAKWLGACERTGTSVLSTVDLVEKLSNMRAVQVL